MSLINSTAIPNGAKAYEIEQSLRHNDDNDAKLSFTPATNGTSTDVFTVSFWFKRGKLGHAQYLFDISETTISFGDNDKLVGNLRGTTSGNYFWYTNAKFRDTSAWYHIVAAWDSTQSTDTNRFKLYVNGVIQTFSSISYMPQNREMKNNSVHYIGYEGSGYASDGYFAEVNFIDGQTKAPTDFGETGDYGEWKPIEYEGTYGTNGFYLPFKQDYTVEGFSTVTYRGNGGTQYIGGTGFSPDFTWIKNRGGSDSHFIYDSVRGARNYLGSNTTTAQAATNQMTEFATDGFVVNEDGGSATNDDGDNFVAWNWDMDAGTRTKHKIDLVSVVKHDTGAQKFGPTSILMDGDGDYAKITGTTAEQFAFGTGDFTYECWVRFLDITNDSSQNVFFDSRTGTGATGVYLYKKSNHKIGFYNGSAQREGTTTMANNTWYHLAWTRSSGTVRMFVNGSKEYEGTENINLVDKQLVIGGDWGTYSGATHNFKGYFDDIRVSKIARYTANFSVPTATFDDDNNTVLLIHSNTTNNSTEIVDGSNINTDGSIRSIVTANPTYGQSIVKYVGAAGVSNATKVGHGLNSAPEMIIIKEYTNNQYWPVWHKDMHSDGGFDRKMYLNTNGAVSGTDQRRVTSVSSTTFGLPEGATSGGYSESNKIDRNHIAYVFHSVAGYSKCSSYSGTGGTHTVTTGFAPAFVMLKSTDATHPWVMLDNVRQATGNRKEIYANTSAGEGDNSSVFFTSTGFQITTDNSYTNESGKTFIYMAFADKREYAYWLDQSGNNNDWTSNNLTESDIMVDSPTNNFSTFNPLDPQGTTSITFSEGNLKVVQAASWTGAVNNVLMTSGKWYWEVCGIDMSNLGVGVIKPNGAQHLAMNVANNGYFGKADRGYGINFQHGNDIDFFTNTSETTQQMFSSYSNGDIAQVAYDADTGKIWIAKNNIWGTTSGGVGNPATGANPAATVANPEEGYLAGFALENCTLVANFGQDSSFAGNKTAQGNQDGNDIGDFYYTPPSGFLALCTKNLPEPAVIPSEHFNTVLWTASGSANQAITGVGFQPDFNWIKDRTGGNSHHLFDAVRGAGKRLMSNAADVESTVNSHTAFNTDGFTLGAVGTGISVSGNSHVAWNWKANGAGASNTDGSINTTKTSANVDAGFSIMTYTGTNSTRTIGHGLSKPPEFWVTKPRTDVSDNQWFACHKGFATDYYTDFIHFDTSGAKQDSSARWGDTAPTDSVITIGPASTNVASGDYVCYAWHSVEGYSKVGSYEGNNSADGTFVYTGFRPAFIIVKNSDTGNNWIMSDTKREPTNVMADELYPDLSNAEYISSGERWDFLSNGFKLRSGSAVTNEDTHIYIAFAETPFKYSNAR